MQNASTPVVGSLLSSKETASRRLIEGIRIIAMSIAAAAARQGRAAPVLSPEDGGCQAQRPAARIDGNSKDP
jgi:hypothetical protein